MSIRSATADNNFFYFNTAKECPFDGSRIEDDERTPLTIDKEIFPKYIAPPAAAGAAIFPVFYGLSAKSALQLGSALPRVAPKELVRDAGKAAPIVAVQVLIQGVVERSLAAGVKDSGMSLPEFAFTLISSAAVGVVSAPALAAFNGLTLKTPIPVMQSIRGLSRGHVGAITARDTGFLAGAAGAEPLNEAMRSSVGDSSATRFGAAFASGVIGSIAGHPFDTALTRWQAGLPVELAPQLFKGGATRALTIGMFCIFHKAAKEQLI